MTVDMLMIGVLLCIAVNIGLILAIKNLWSIIGSLQKQIDLLQERMDNTDE